MNGIWSLIGQIATGIAGIGAICGVLFSIYRAIIKFHNRNEDIAQIPTQIKVNNKQKSDIQTLMQKFDNFEKKISKDITNVNSRLDDISKKLDLNHDLAINEARYILENTMNRSIEIGSVTTRERMIIGDLFASYIKAGGNHGVADLFHSAYKVLPIQNNKS